MGSTKERRKCAKCNLTLSVDHQQRTVSAEMFGVDTERNVSFDHIKILGSDRKLSGCLGGDGCLGDEVAGKTRPRGRNP